MCGGLGWPVVLSPGLFSHMAEEGNVRVGVRVRPLLDRELAEDARICVSHPADNVVRIGKVSDS